MEGTFNERKCELAASDPLLLATDLAVFWSVKERCPEAHHVVGELVGLAESKGVSLLEISDGETWKYLNFYLANGGMSLI